MFTFAGEALQLRLFILLGETFLLVETFLLFLRREERDDEFAEILGEGSAGAPFAPRLRRSGGCRQGDPRRGPQRGAI